MAQPITAAIPGDVDIGSAYTLQIAAQNPTTGATVAGVNISGFVIEATAEGSGTLASGLFAPVLIRQQPGGG